MPNDIERRARMRHRVRSVALIDQLGPNLVTGAADDWLANNSLPRLLLMTCWPTGNCGELPGSLFSPRTSSLPCSKVVSQYR
jgi:hypothetical protein